MLSCTMEKKELPGAMALYDSYQYLPSGESVEYEISRITYDMIEASENPDNY
jgi:hypothetical protein